MRRLAFVLLSAAIAACASTTTLPSSGGIGPQCVTRLELSLQLEIASDASSGAALSQTFSGSQISSLYFRRDSKWVSWGPEGRLRSPVLRIRVTGLTREQIVAIRPRLWTTVGDARTGDSQFVPTRYSLRLLADGNEVLRDGLLELEGDTAMANFPGLGIDFETFRGTTWSALGCW